VRCVATGTGRVAAPPVSPPRGPEAEGIVSQYCSIAAVPGGATQRCAAAGAAIQAVSAHESIRARPKPPVFMYFPTHREAIGDRASVIVIGRSPGVIGNRPARA
jgi:hypothetical protein